MTNSESADIETAIRLLSDRSPSTVQASYAECSAIVARNLNGGSEFLLRLITAAIEADVHKITLIDDAVSFLDDTDLRQLAFLLQGQAERGADVEDLLTHAVLQ
ncbi:MAG: hypothetical protein E5V18_09380, partial [Mesorhizobium sp.]